MPVVNPPLKGGGLFTTGHTTIRQGRGSWIFNQPPMSIKPYNEGFKPKHVAPAFGGNGATDFPTEEVIAHLDGENPSHNDWEKIDPVTIFRTFLEWIVTIKAKDNRGLSPIATRTLACVWVINPELLGNAPAHMVAKSFGISHQKFSVHAAEFSRRFQVRNHFQVHDSKNKKH